MYRPKSSFSAEEEAAVDVVVLEKDLFVVYQVVFQASWILIDRSNCSNFLSIT